MSMVRFSTNNCISHNTQKRANEPLQGVAVVTAIPPILAVLLDENEFCEAAHQVASFFWFDNHICKLFNISDIENKLAEWLKKLNNAEFHEKKMSNLVNKSGEHPLQINHILNIQCKVM